jgi:lipopolysaccharide export LptBFGC system permease protein LptF
MLFLYLIPQAIPLAVVFGLPIGILVGLRKRPPTRRITWSIVGLALASTALTFLVCAWVLPEANQAFRGFVFVQSAGRGFPARGANELTFSELSKQITLLKTHGRLAEARPLLWSYHGRLAASTAPFIWAIFALGLSRIIRRSLVAIVTCIVAAIVYVTYAWGVVAAPSMTYPWLPPELVCWLPNVLFASLTIALWKAGTQSPTYELGAHP